MKSAEKILETIKRDGSVTAKQLAEKLGMTTMGARQHLQALEHEGFVSFSDLKVKIGRPTRHWVLTTKGHSQFSDRHSDLTIQVIEAVENLFGVEGLQKIADEREAKTYSFYTTELDKCATLERKLERLVELRQQEGYMAELQVQGDTVLLIENHCPICKAAIRCPMLCKSELKIFQRLLGEKCQVERREHIVQGARRCVYYISKRD